MAYQPKSYRKFVATAATATLVASAVTPALAAPTQGASDNFTDVSDRYKEAVDYLVGEKVTIGLTPTKFGTQENIKRVDVAVMVARATLAPEVIENAPLSSFTDVPDRARLYVDSLKAAGIINGKTATNFGSADNITRGEAALMLAKAYGLEKKGEDQAAFTDVSARYKDAVEMLVDNGITNGKTATSFGTADSITRGELAIFLYKLEKLQGGVTPEVPVEGYTLQLSSKDATLDADGADNTVLTAKIIDNKTGQVDVDADDIVLSFDASHGSLANTRVTVKDGVATVLLTSEFSQKELTSVITAKLIETAPDSEWADQIGKLIAAQTVKFTPVSGSVTQGITLTGAESNEADRVTLFFNENVTPEMFLKKDDPLTVQIGQDNGVKPIAGYKAVEGNPKAIQVILGADKETAPPTAAQVLTDNKQVFVSQPATNTTKTFNLTDARQPEATSVKQVAYNKVEVTFSEPVAQVNLDQVSIDGGVVNVTKVENGLFSQEKGDKRNTITVTTEKFIPAGDHSIQLSGIKDYAGLSDNANVSTNQIFDFNVPGSNVVPAATFTVESPEQLRLQFNTMVEGFDTSEVSLEVYNPVSKNWEKISDWAPGLVKATEVEKGVEYTYELTQDWTKIFAAAGIPTDNYYNHQFRAVIEKDAVVNPANELKNVKQEIDLSYAGSPLTTPDTTSPTLVGVPTLIEEGVNKGKWYVSFSEPVKDRGLDLDDTPSVLQGTTIPKVVVEFIGTDKDGKKVTVTGKVESYYDDKGKDTKLLVSADQSLQGLVDNSGYTESWQLVMRNVTDDVGNAATTLTQNFTVTQTPSSTVFAVKDLARDLDKDGVAGYDGISFNLNGAADDTIVLDFTSAVQYTGNTANALNASNYTLNGEPLPKGTVLKLSDSDANSKNGYDIVTITLPNGSLDGATNVLNISKDLKSANGTPISGLTEVAEAPVGGTTPVEQELQQEIAESNTAVNNAVAGSQPGQYPQAAIDEFKSAIAAAQTVLNNPASTDAQVAAAKADLEAAQAKFEASKITDVELGEVVITSADYQANDAAIGLGLIPHRIMGTVAEAGVTEVQIKLDGDPDIAGGKTYTAPVTNGKFDYTVAVNNSGAFTTAQASYTKNGETVSSDTVTIVSLSTVAPKVSNVSISTAAGEKVTATVENNTITFNGVQEDVAYTTGTVTLSEDVKVEGLGKERDVKRNDDFVAILDAMFDQNVDGSVKGSVLLGLDGETLTFTDIDGSKTVYTLVVK